MKYLRGISKNMCRLRVKPAQIWSETCAGSDPNPRGFDDKSAGIRKPSKMALKLDMLTILISVDHSKKEFGQ